MSDVSAPITRAGLIASQPFGLGFCPYILKPPPVVNMTANKIIDWIGPVVPRHLFGD